MTAAQPAAVLLLGDLLVDHTIVLDHVPRAGEDSVILHSTSRPGGCALNVAVTLANLGDGPLPVSRLGVDREGDAVVAQVDAIGIDRALVERDPSWTTGYTYAMVDRRGERTFMTCRPSTGDRYRRVDSGAELLAGRAAAAVYVTGYALRSRPLAEWVVTVVRDLRAAGSVVVFDPGPLLAEAPADLVAELLRVSDWCVPNAGELAIIGTELAGHGDPVGYVHDLGCSLLVVKHGGDGAEAFAADGQRWAAPALAVDVVDTNGAGDAFVGGLIHGIVGGLPVADVLDLATACGALATTVAGSHGAFARAQIETMAAAVGSRPVVGARQ